jgi:SAP domain-containing ribonucleoprotein
MSEQKLKALKVVELKDILSKAAVSVPAKANKQDLIARILANPAAVSVYKKLQNPAAPAPPVQQTNTADDLVHLFYIYYTFR